MNFELTVDQNMLEQGVADMLKAELPPEMRRSIAYENAPVNNLWRSASEFGLPGLVISESYGGTGLTLIEAVLTIKKAGFSALPLPIINHFVVALTLQQSQDLLPQQTVENWLTNMASGSCIATCAVETTPQDQAQSSRFCSWVEYASDASLLLIKQVNGAMGLLELNVPGVFFTQNDSVDLTRPSYTVQFSDEHIHPLTAITPDTFENVWRILLAADSWGLADYILDTVTDYAVTRKQFGRLIGEFQSVKHPLAEARMKHTLSEPLLWQAALDWQQYQSNGQESALLCKAHITELTITIIRSGIQLMGAYGFSWESDLHLWLKRAQSNAALLGSPYVTRKLLAKQRGWRQ